MNPAVQRYLEAAMGLTNLTASRAEQVVKQLVRSGEAASDQVSELVDDLLERQRRNRESVAAIVRGETGRAVRAAGLATSEEIEQLQRQVADLQREVSRLTSATSAAAAAKKTAAKKATAKKGTAKKSTAKKASGSRPTDTGTATARKRTP